MPISLQEIRNRALAFSREWKDAESERAEAQSFWNDFFQVFGIHRRRVAIFEKQVELSGARKKLKGGRIDAFWKGVLLIEHKSAGGDLDRAFAQAADYFEGIAERDLPQYILVSDFKRFRLYDLEADKHWEFPLKDLHEHVKRFGFISGYAPQEIKPQDPVNIDAAEQMGKLHDLLKASGYSGHDLEVLLVRLVFCLFADDTGIFPKQAFRDWLEARTAEDGSDLGPQVALLFQVLNTPENKRQKNLDEQLAALAYVNGKLFEETLQLASFDSKMRSTLLDCCALNWGAVSPAIFGALFQSIMDEKARRNLGAHYTSEENILKLIKPLFLDDLWAEFNKVKGNKNRLFEFHKKLRSLVFLDPACGCGNFLVITYRELRQLELEVLRAVHGGPGSRFLNIHQELTLDVDQFYGIEIEEFPAQIAQVALWLIDHQMNLKVSEEFGMYFARIPLKTTPHIVCDNALRIDWSQVVPAERLSYIVSNPPFVGFNFTTEAQRADLLRVFQGMVSPGLLDFVAAWYVVAARFMKGTHIRAAFVSTSSITQGEQVGALWGWLLSQGVRIHFAHRTFQWSNEARGVAAVHCVIVGFGFDDLPNKIIFEYDDPRGAPHPVSASNISPYLIDGPDVIASGRMYPICSVPSIVNGNIPADGGNLILTEADREELLKNEPQAAKYIRPYLGAEGFIHKEMRYCLWLAKRAPEDFRDLPLVRQRIKAVQEMRQASSKAATRAKAATPYLFTEIRQPTGGHYLAIPRTSSENRKYLPIGWLSAEIIAANDLQLVPDATLYHFGVLVSGMHKAWTDVTAGRLESRIRYSVKTTYNTFPWPQKIGERARAIVETAAQRVLDARAEYPESSLAALYDALTMPQTLVQAHQALDRAVDAAYIPDGGKRKWDSDAERVAFLFGRYRELTSLLPPDASGSRKSKAPKRPGRVR